MLNKVSDPCLWQPLVRTPHIEDQPSGKAIAHRRLCPLNRNAPRPAALGPRDWMAGATAGPYLDARPHIHTYRRHPLDLDA
jgi:hypothetical protein